MSELNELVALLKAAGETTRLRLVALLMRGELSVKDLTEILEQSQPRVSRHLKLLADAGVVERYAEGAWAYYRLMDAAPVTGLIAWIEATLARDDPQTREDARRLEAVRAAHDERAAAYFATVADSWDLLRNLHVPESAVEAAILEVVGDRQVDLLLDLGTGTGRMLELLADRYRKGIGIDSSREMLAVARSKLALAGVTHAQVRLGDILDIDINGARADLVVLHQVLHYFDDPARVLTQARQVMQPGGAIVVVDFAPHDLEFLRTHHAHRRLGLSAQQMDLWARAADLEVARYQDFPNGTGTEGLTVCVWLLRDAQPAEKQEGQDDR